ncbi:MAG: M48 family metallopeptidase, partial [Planctomycetota bacterium]|nr:M48 family metallopeptidase [Planctomycetota bacterium]
AVAVLVAFGAVLGAATGFTPWGGMGIASVIGLVLALVAWNQGSDIVLASAGAREIRKEEDPELVNVIEEMSIASGLPRPRIYLIDDDAMNAFATGMKPDQGVVAITRGLRQTLSRDELQGVMAHEMAHIGNFDTRVMVLMAVIVGSVAIMADWYLRSMRYSRGGGSGKNKGQAALIIAAILLAILAPIMAKLIQFAVSRKREYLADATAAKLTRNPGALADALDKLANSPVKLKAANRGTQHMFIVNPFRLRQKLSHAFATHPPVADRIHRLRRLAGATQLPAR